MARNANLKDSISAFIRPDNGYRGTQIRHGIQPKNHMKVSEREESGSEVERRMEEAKQYSDAQPLTPRKSSLPREYGTLSGPTTVDYVMRNKVEAMQLLPEARSEKMVMNRPTVHEDFGRVPEYLEERKARWAAEEEEERRRRPDPNCPPGMCLMSEEERCDTLDTLQASKNESLVQLRRLPFVVETPTMKKRQEFLEGKLREIDNAIAIFSKKKVYVAMGR
ncbi:calmodulin-binding-domain-containing protein [Ochromonadaceae sp. CCMP2298]|nr:calmodulin-binding-domain-containing protein [Ochromonadaceae sp. CCMP2298]